jgi:hypothetical protein
MSSPPPAPPRANPLHELAVAIIAPSIVLTMGEPYFGNTGTLLVALAFPLAWGAWDGWRRRRVSIFTVIGAVSTLLTGGIGLMKLDAGWLAIKEGAVSGAIGLAVAVSAWTKRPLIHLLVFDAALLDRERIARALAERGTTETFEARLRQGTLWLAATFFFSAAANYALTRWLVQSPAGTEAFNAELGRLTLLSWPLIALPSTAMMAALLWWLARCARQLTGLELQDLLGGA